MIVCVLCKGSNIKNQDQDKKFIFFHQMKTYKRTQRIYTRINLLFILKILNAYIIILFQTYTRYRIVSFTALADSIHSQQQSTGLMGILR